ncbi:dihydrofolate reductase family protein [Gordonia sp. CPCC 205333]|uniref:dihydrofolate reductase family protein n=1 Tax=Gordonia sp. CPCC 205333 TaxID=3140790 RepID=UPI003AF34AA5
MRPLRYSINITLDGCCDHREGVPDEQTHLHAAQTIAEADAILLGRTTFEIMRDAWRGPELDPGMPEWTKPFAEAINSVKKYVVSSTLADVDWNAELLRGDLRQAVIDLKSRRGYGIFVGGVQLPLALAEWGLIDECELVVHPTVAGHGPWLFEGLSHPLGLKPLSRKEFRSGVVATRYEVRK